MRYHYVITIRFNHGRRGKYNTIYTGHGHADIKDDTSQKQIYDDVVLTTTRVAGSDPEHSSVLFYRAVPDPV